MSEDSSISIEEVFGIEDENINEDKLNIKQNTISIINIEEKDISEEKTEGGEEKEEEEVKVIENIDILDIEASEEELEKYKNMKFKNIEEIEREMNKQNPFSKSGQQIRYLLEERKKEMKKIKEEEISKLKPSKLGREDIMKVALKINNSIDLFNLLCVNKKCREINKSLKKNMYDLKTDFDKRLFEDIETLNIYSLDVLKNIYEQALQYKRLKIKPKKSENLTLREEIELLNENNDKAIEFVRNSRLPKELDMNGITMVDIGNVIAPRFKKVTNINININENDDENEVKEIIKKQRKMLDFIRINKKE